MGRWWIHARASQRDRGEDVVQLVMDEPVDVVLVRRVELEADAVLVERADTQHRLATQLLANEWLDVGPGGARVDEELSCLSQLHLDLPVQQEVEDVTPGPGVSGAQLLHRVFQCVRTHR